MLTSAELLRKFAQFLGIRESEARSGFENFVLHFTEKYPLGTQIKVESLGYFSYKKIAGDLSSYNEFQSVIIFSAEPLASSTNDIVLFFIPDEQSQNISAVDSYLNLSFGNDELLYSEKSKNEFLKGHSLAEINSLIESKIEKLFSETVEVIEGDKTEEFILAGDDNAIVSENIDKIETTAEHENVTENDVTQVPKDETEDLAAADYGSFDLVEPVNTDKNDQLIEDKINNKKWEFDDLALETELSQSEKSEVVENGFTEVKSEIPDSLKEDNENLLANSHEKKLTKSDKKLKHRKIRRILFTTILILFLVASVVGVYFNQNEIADLISKYSGNKLEPIVIREKVIPNIIERDPSLMISGVYTSDLKFQNFIIVDSLIISSKIYSMMKLKSDNYNNDLYEDNLQQ